MPPRFDAVLFDCDGVLVDSEPITNGVLRQMLNEAGWALDPAECAQIFIGKAVRDERERIERETGQPLTDDWIRRFYARRDARLRAELQTVAGALAAVVAAHRHTAGRIACASGADKAKVVMQIEMAGMAPYFGDRIFSGHDLPRSKPHPDVYLAAAAHVGAEPARCLVVEDTATGVQAGLAAGATVWGYCPEGHGRAFAGLPVARVLRHMDELAAALQPAPAAQPRNPLHGVTLEAMVRALAAHYGWAELGRRLPMRCFTHDPSVASSLKFLRKTPWAREKVEGLYLFMLREARRGGRRAG